MKKFKIFSFILLFLTCIFPLFAGYTPQPLTISNPTIPMGAGQYVLEIQIIGSKTNIVIGTNSVIWASTTNDLTQPYGLEFTTNGFISVWLNENAFPASSLAYTGNILTNGGTLPALTNIFYLYGTNQIYSLPNPTFFPPNYTITLWSATATCQPIITNGGTYFAVPLYGTNISFNMFGSNSKTNCLVLTVRPPDGAITTNNWGQQ